MDTYSIIDQTTGKTLSQHANFTEADKAAHSLNEFDYQAGQSPSDSHIGFNPYPSRYQVRRDTPVDLSPDTCPICDKLNHDFITEQGICNNCFDDYILLNT